MYEVSLHQIDKFYFNFTFKFNIHYEVVLTQMQFNCLIYLRIALEHIKNQEQEVARQ